MWSILSIDNRLLISGITNFNKTLFFGKQPQTGETIAHVAGEENREQTEIIEKNIQKAQNEKRNVFFMYTTDSPNQNVCAHVEYLDSGSVQLYLTAVEADDVSEQSVKDSKKLDGMFEAIYDNIPVGVEVYDRHGRLIDINAQGLRDIEIESKESVLGICLYDNPIIPDDMKERLRQGENMHFRFEYDFKKLNGFIKTPKQDINTINVSISVKRSSNGEIDKYIIISQDISDIAELQKKYQNLYNQSNTIIESLPIGVGLYKPNGEIAYFNKRLRETLSVPSEFLESNKLNINNNPFLPKNIGISVRDGFPINIVFPYDFKKVADAEHYKSTRTDEIQIEANGIPIINIDGEYENYVCIMRDITEELKWEDKIVNNRRKTELAIKAADIMLWEFDVATQLFYSDNEPLNEYDQLTPISIDLYLNAIHPDDRYKITDILQDILNGVEFSFDIELRAALPGSPDWQFCSINGIPYEFSDSGKVTKYIGTRKNDTELYKRKQLQEKILNTIPLSIHIKDVENDFRYVFCNDESKRLFGSSEETTTYDIMSEENVDRIRKTDFEVYKTGIPYTGTEHVVLKDGREYDTIVRKDIIIDNNKRLLISIRWDQSLQNELQRRAKLLDLTMGAMSAFTWFYEPDKERITFGDGFDQIGRKTSFINSHKTFMECIYPDDIQKYNHSLEEILKNESGEWKIECRADLNGDGIYTWWESKGILETTIIDGTSYKYIYGMTICIEPHKQAELTLLKNKEELRSLILQNELILNNTNSGLAFISMDYIVQWENISLCSASLSLEAYKRGEHCYKSAHNRTSPCENCVMQRALVSHQMEQTQFTLENDRMVEILATPIFNKDKSMDGIVIRIDDITERQQMIEELKEAKMLAEQSDKLKSAFLANMSHEIRTPLNAIVGFSELLINTTEEEEQQEYLNIINNNNDLLLKLINDILDLSKIEAGSIELKLENFDMTEYFNGMVSSMSQRIKNPNIRLIDINPYNECKVHLDKNRVAQLITNYVTNAIKYTPKGFIEMGYTSVEDGIRIYVKDSGIGIPEDKKNKVFHRFAKLDEFAQGTGLGLSICKAIAESMNGNVGFESKFGEGSLFWAFLPCSPKIKINESNETDNKEEENQQDISANKNITKIDDNRKTILIAEDIASNYLLISSILKKQFDIIHAMNGEEAVEMARNNKVDLVLMDMKMPVMNGLIATAEIRKFNNNLPIVALTAHAFESDRIAALKAGCNEFLVKPINREQLVAVLQKYCSVLLITNKK